MKAEGPIKEASYYYPAKQINKFMESLVPTNRVEPFYASIPDKIVVLTHDDQLDYGMLETEEGLGLTSTFFVLPNKLERLTRNDEADIQLHFDKEHSRLQHQIDSFVKFYGYTPTSCRIHRLLWRADNFDFPFLASKRFVVDSTKIGITPYLPCISGRLLPIWEVPVAVSDTPPNDGLMAVYNVSSKVETLFKRGESPIVVNAHPREVVQKHRMASCYETVLTCLQKYNYECLNLTQFYDRYLAKRGLLRES